MQSKTMQEDNIWVFFASGVECQPDSILLRVVYSSLRGNIYFLLPAVYNATGFCIYIYGICLFFAVGNVECIGTIVSLSVVSNVTEAG